MKESPPNDPNRSPFTSPNSASLPNPQKCRENIHFQFSDSPNSQPNLCLHLHSCNGFGSCCQFGKKKHRFWCRFERIPKGWSLIMADLGLPSIGLVFRLFLLLLVFCSPFAVGDDVSHDDDDSPKIPGCSNSFQLVIVLPSIFFFWSYVCNLWQFALKKMVCIWKVGVLTCCIGLARGELFGDYGHTIRGIVIAFLEFDRNA